MFSCMRVITLTELVFCVISDFIFTQAVGQPVATQGIDENPTWDKAITFTSPLR